MQLLKSLFGRIRTKEKQNSQAILKGAKRAIYLMALSEMQLPIHEFLADPSNDSLRETILEEAGDVAVSEAEIARRVEARKALLVENHLEAMASEIEYAGLTEDDVRRTVDSIKRRFADARLSEHLETLQERAALAEQNRREYETAEFKRQAAARDHINSLGEAERAAIDAAASAIAARGNLIAGAEVGESERDAIEQLRLLRVREAELQTRLKPNAPLDGNMSPSCERLPAVAERRALAEISEREKEPRKNLELLARLRETLAAARQFKTAAEHELAAVTRSIQSVQNELEEFHAAKSLPESFRIIHNRPSRDEQRKKHAVERGLDVLKP